MYVLVTADADVIPTGHALAEIGKQVILLCPDIDVSLGHVLAQCPFQIEAAPMASRHKEQHSIGVQDRAAAG
jgi:phage baseplate assembly protein gpV